MSLQQQHGTAGWILETTAIAAETVATVWDADSTRDDGENEAASETAATVSETASTPCAVVVTHAPAKKDRALYTKCHRVGAVGHTRSHVHNRSGGVGGPRDAEATPDVACASTVL